MVVCAGPNASNIPATVSIFTSPTGYDLTGLACSAFFPLSISFGADEFPQLATVMSGGLIASTKSVTVLWPSESGRCTTSLDFHFRHCFHTACGCGRDGGTDLAFDRRRIRQMKSSCANKSQPIREEMFWHKPALRSAVGSYSDSPASRLMRLISAQSVLHDFARAPGDSIHRSSN
jgi:hypothetical protein